MSGVGFVGLVRILLGHEGLGFHTYAELGVPSFSFVGVPTPSRCGLRSRGLKTLSSGSVAT